MSRRLRRWSCGAWLLLCLVPSGAAGQSAPPKPVATDTVPAGESRLWLVAGGASATVRGHCQTCEEDFPYRHGGSVLVDAGYRATRRMDAGVEVFWVPTPAAAGHIRTTHVDAVAQFRPWSSQGFLLKGGAGMAFVRNWVDGTNGDAITSKALSLVIGAGWQFHHTGRFGFQVFAAQHAAALGDLTTASGDVQDVIGNFWSIGGAIVIR